MLHIGGEQELVECHYAREITNSGRSSLRLIIESAKLEGKKILLPDFLCEVIVDVLSEYDMSVDFYKVDQQFDFTLPDDLDEYAAIYLIKYFGFKSASYEIAVNRISQTIIIDDVFSPYPEVLESHSSWYSFNSLRKISAVADFSYVYGTDLISSDNYPVLSEFARLKYQGKNQKYQSLLRNNEDALYLKSLNAGESALDNAREIYRASNQSTFAAVDFYANLPNEKILRAKNAETIKKQLPHLCSNLTSEFYSFLPIFLNSRDKIRYELMDSNIFLAVHWPDIKGCNNALSSNILSIPTDSRYGENELNALCLKIESLVNE